MELFRPIAAAIIVVLYLYVIVLLARLVLEWMPILNRGWRPKGGMLVAAEVVYTITDPPIKLFRKVIPPLRVGGIALDFAFALTMMLCFVAISVLQVAAR